jgi:hypothetical protein
LVEIRSGHGSPSEDQRVGTVPYIKVSDLRAGMVNINPTNLIPFDLARRFWKQKSKQDELLDAGTIESGLEPYDLISPERASKNIGEFCVLMPGQENVVLTREVIVIRPGPDAPFDRFYLMWALSLRTVRQQWERVIFMQTNREDVGKRYLEIVVPMPKSEKVAQQFAKPFRDYFHNLQKSRGQLKGDLAKLGSDHFIFFV